MKDSILPPEVIRLARAIRFAFVSILLGLSYLNVRSSLSIPAFDQLFHDMMNGKPLPVLTKFVISASFLLNVLNLLIPLVIIGTLFSHRFIACFYLLGVLALVIMAELLLLFYALSGPLFQIVTGLQGVQ